MDLIMSSLEKTWLLDLDGTLLEHNGYLHGGDSLLPGAKEFAQKAFATGRIIILTSRKEEYKDETIAFLEKAGLPYHDILFGMPSGERVLINDKKPSGLKTAFAINVVRNEGINVNITIDEDL